VLLIVDLYSTVLCLLRVPRCYTRALCYHRVFCLSAKLLVSPGTIQESRFFDRASDNYTSVQQLVDGQASVHERHESTDPKVKHIHSDSQDSNTVELARRHKDR
jgi:hypothetical protein